MTSIFTVSWLSSLLWAASLHMSSPEVQNVIRFRPGDLVQIVHKDEAVKKTWAYEDWLSWDPSLSGKIGVVLSEQKMYVNGIQVFCDGKEVWTVAYFLKKID